MPNGAPPENGTAVWSRLWRERRWLFISAAGAAAYLIGFAGFAAAHEGESGSTATGFDFAYAAIQLFVLEWSDVPGPVPWTLQLARFLAPAVAAYAAIAALAQVFREQADGARLRFFSGHVVVCGLGRKGLQVAQDFLRLGRRVVVIEREDGVDEIRLCRELGAVVLIGDATEASLLQRARLGQARNLVAVTENDLTNVEIALRAQALRPDPGLRCFVHLFDLPLGEVFRAHRLFRDVPQSRSVELHVFNVYENGARLLLRHCPLERDLGGPDDARTVHLIVVGFGQMGQSLALQAARVGHFANGRRVRVTAVDREVDRRAEAFRGRHPAVPDLVDLRTIQGDVTRATVLDQIRDEAERPDTLTTLAVCLDDDRISLSCAIQLQRKLPESTHPLLVRMSQGAGLASVFEDQIGGATWSQTLHPFGMIDR